jgi:hypothetical protein
MTERRDTPDDRRQCRRVPDANEHGIRSIRIRPGHAANVVDVSSSGALVETSHRLLPGAVVELHVETDGQRANVRGRVVRCSVVRVRAATVFYRGGIAFDRHLPWFVPEEGYRLPAAEQSDSQGKRDAATRVVV